MPRTPFRCVRVAVIALLTALSSHPTPLAAQQLDTASALEALRDAATACATDAGRLWGRSLCGPIALVERNSRLVIANDSITGRAFAPMGAARITTAPGAVFANTSVEWGGRSWATIVLPLPRDRFDRAALVLHEVFHREQRALGLVREDAPNNQLDQADGRRWFRLELRALASALDAIADGKANARARALTGVTDALMFRAQRRALYPLADSLEPLLEMQEGLPEYTGVRLAMTLTGERAARAAGRVRDFQRTTTYVRSFAYASGPALGLLLDEFASGWRDSVRVTADPARLLARAVRFAPPKSLATVAEGRAKAYGVEEVDREEGAREAARGPRMAAYRARLVTGPTITLPVSGSLNRNFNPDALVGFDMRNTLYPTGAFSSDWGSLELTDGGALLANDFSTLRIAAPTPVPTAMTGVTVIKGDGYMLTLRAGWSLQPDPQKPGSLRVVRLPEPA